VGGLQRGRHHFLSEQRVEADLLQVGEQVVEDEVQRVQRRVGGDEEGVAGRQFGILRAVVSDALRPGLPVAAVQVGRVELIQPAGHDDEAVLGQQGQLGLVQPGVLQEHDAAQVNGQGRQVAAVHVGRRDPHRIG